MVCGCNGINSTPDTQNVGSGTGKKSSSDSNSNTKSSSKSKKGTNTSSTNPFNTLLVTQTGKKHDLDILFVIDYGNGDETDQAREKLGENFNAMKEHLKDVDWQMAFLDTSGNGLFLPLENEDGPVEDEDDEENYIYVLKHDMNDLEELFNYTVDRNSSTSNSQPLQSITKAFEINGSSSTNSKKISFFRKDASLAVILLTSHNGSGQTGRDTITKVTQKLGHQRFISYGFLAKGDEACPSQQSSTLTVKQMIVFTQGIIGDFCGRNTEYRNSLKKISKHLQVNLVETDLSIQSEISLLQSDIIESSVDVTFKPTQNAVDWNFDADTNTILLDEVPALDTQIKITYSYIEDDDDDEEEDD